MERALSIVLRRETVTVTVAGRTDTGVHAWGQVASYSGEAVDPGSLNALLPVDVAVVSCEPAPEGFDARRDATSRAYCYRVLARRERSAFWSRRALHWPHRVELDQLDACAAELAGAHDFTAFTPTDTDHVRFEREVYAARWARCVHPGSPRGGLSELLEFWIEADSFMRHMNRVLVGTMLEVAAGRRPPESFRELLSGRPRTEAGPTAPACGLYLAEVGYRGNRVLRN